MADMHSNVQFGAYSGQKTLVVGGAGFIGSNLARTLVDLGAEVTVSDNYCSNCGANPYNLADYMDKLNFVHGDVGDKQLAKQLVEGQNMVFMLAGHTSHTDSMNDPFTDLNMNVIAKLSVLEACRHANLEARIVYTSTRQIYGKPRYLPVRESHPLDPVDVNGINEIAAEHYHHLYHRIYDLDITVLRLTNVFGPRMRIRDSRQNFVGWWIRRLLEGDVISIYGDGQQLRDLLYVDDVIDAILRSGLRPFSIGETLNLGAHPISLLDLAEMMIEVHGSGSYKLVPFPRERKMIDIGSYYGDYAKAKKILGWSPQTNLATGLKQTFEYFAQHQDYYT